mgnify:FL=1
MNKIKFLKHDKIALNGIVYKPYKICELPVNFGCLMFNTEREGISEWFKYKGYTYIAE